MKDPREWDEAYLFSLPVGEFDWLEVKGRRAIDVSCPGVDENDVRQTLSKAVSAFANSGGGILVIGLVNPKCSWQVDDGGVSLTAKKPSTREWLEDIIPMLVDLPLQKFNVYTILPTNSESPIATGRAVFVIHIPDSEQAPHQAGDNRYYARVAGKSRPVSHLFVLDILGRRQHPKVQIECSVASVTYTPQSPFGFPTLHARNEPRERKTKVSLVCRAKNVGSVFASYVNCRLRLPLEMLEITERTSEADNAMEIDGIKYVEWTRRNVRRDVLKADVFGPSQYGPSWFDPILPQLSYEWEWNLRPDLDMSSFANHRIYWFVYADNAPMQLGSELIGEVEYSHKEES